MSERSEPPCERSEPPSPSTAGQTTYVCPSTVDRPTAVDPPPPPPSDPYYGYRLTRPHSSWPEIRCILCKYSSDWLVGLHFPDTEEDGCDKEHYHMVMRDFDGKKVDSFKKAIAKWANGSGNGLHAGRFRDNHISHAVGYMKHDDRVEFFHTGQSYWTDYISGSPSFVKNDNKRQRVVKERLGDPVLTYGNLVKQAVKYRSEHMADANSLQNVLSRMVHQSGWIPSRELVRNGVPRELHEMFLDRITKRQRDYDWMKPHVPSDDKLKWLDRVDDTPVILGGMVANPAGPPVFKGLVRPC